MRHIAFTTLIVLVAIGLYLGGRHVYFQPSYEAGEMAPAFTAELPSGKTFSLEDLRGDYVLIDFWGSWCPPCRKENPELMRLSNTFQSADFQEAEGFHVVAIGVEKDAVRWRNAIERDELALGYHILDQATSLRFFDSAIAKLYGVKQVPTKFLVGPKGELLIVDGSLEEIEAYLQSH
jgi:thiol-disulfide isomerase/thioredoxin